MAENIISKLNVGGTEYDIVATSAKDTSAVAGVAATTVTGQAASGEAASAWLNANATGTAVKSAVSAGTAEEAAKLSTARNIAASGNVEWTVSFDGSTGVTGDATIKSVPASAISAVNWSSLSTLTANSAATTTSGIMTPDQIQAAIAAKVGELASFEVVSTTAQMTKTNVIYLIKSTEGKEDNYDEYVVIGSTPTKIGETSIDLAPYAKIADLSAASANWNAASAYVSANSANIETASGYAADWNTNKAAVTGSATSGAAASAWISSHSANLDKALTAVSTTGYISGNGTTGSKIGLNTTAANAIDAVTGAVTDATAMTAAANSGKLATVGAITGYVEEQLEETIDIADEISDANASKIPYVSAVKTYVDGHTQNAYGQIFVTNGSTTNSASAGKSNDAVEFIAGDNIKLTVGGTKNPSITISAKDTTYTTANFITAGSATNISNAYTYASDWNANKDDVIGSANSGAYASAYILANEDKWLSGSDTKYSISGWNGVTASYTADGSTSSLKVSGVQATSANVGVTKASYVNGETLYVF